MGKYDHLLAPVTLAKTQFRNRIFASPVGLEYYPSDNLHPGDDFIAFYEKKAQGGAATVCDIDFVFVEQEILAEHGAGV